MEKMMKNLIIIVMLIILATFAIPIIFTGQFVQFGDGEKIVQNLITKNFAQKKVFWTKV